jgi:proline racemase
MQRIKVIDSHTGGEPTRVVIEGGPDLGAGTAAERLKILHDQHDNFRSAVVNEPRGSDVVVGAWLFKSNDPTCVTGVIFFNNVGYLGMCGHGTIGVIATLAHQGLIAAGEHRIETPVGVVSATLHKNGRVSVANVPSYRKIKSLGVSVPGVGRVTGDIAWGGNWFFLMENHGQTLELENVDRLAEYAWQVRKAVNVKGYPEVDHVELFGPPKTPGAHSRNFVLCPGKAYDRSPCGTGTCAKLACMAADDKLIEKETWVQESIIGSTFTTTFRWEDKAAGIILPVVTGRAWVNGEATLLIDDTDPFGWGITL